MSVPIGIFKVPWSDKPACKVTGRAMSCHRDWNLNRAIVVLIEDRQSLPVAVNCSAVIDDYQPKAYYQILNLLLHF